jgi:hypothetical protein
MTDDLILRTQHRVDLIDRFPDDLIQGFTHVDPERAPWGRGHLRKGLAAAG